MRIQEPITPGAHDATGYLLRYLLYCSAVCFQSIISSWFDKNRLIVFFLSERQDPGASNGAISLKLRYVSEKC